MTSVKALGKFIVKRMSVPNSQPMNELTVMWKDNESGLFSLPEKVHGYFLMIYHNIGPKSRMKLMQNINKSLVFKLYLYLYNFYHLALKEHGIWNTRLQI